jgi:putative aldouronate transport system permease protein
MSDARLLSRGERAFKIVSYTVMLVAAIAALLPFVLIFAASFTDEQTLLNTGYRFFPRKVSMVAYQYMKSRMTVILRSYGVSVLVTAVGTLGSLILTASLAYPLSRKDFKYRNILSFLVFFTLLFSGGITPAYIMWSRVFHIRNSIWALIVPNFLMNGFNVILVKNYYSNSIPISMIEAAKLDGAGEIRILLSVIVPLSVPVLVTVGLFSGITYWNDWINCLYYVDEPRLFGIQNLLVRMMNNIQFLNSGQASSYVQSGTVALPSTAIRMAMAVIGVLPILVIYPFLQKYLIKGVVLGAVKG